MSNDQMLRDHYISADKIMFGINIGLIIYALLLAQWYGTWVEAMLVGGITAGALVTIYNLAAGTTICRTAMAASFMVMTSLHIHQAHGMIEMHFGVFVLLAVLLYYRDWLPVVVAATVIAVHHFSFFYLQSQGSSLWILQSVENGWWVIFLHAGYVVVESAILIWLAKNLKDEAAQSIELMQLTDHIITDEYINLTLKSGGSTSLLQRFDGFTNEVKELARRVLQTSEQLNQDGQMLATITDDMKSSTKTQQSETDLIASAVEEMSVAIQEVSNNAEVAASSADSVDENAREATKVSKQTLDGVEKLALQVNQAAGIIKDLNRQTGDIGKVLDVIRGVAEQTNLLALNAAIEAARAGEQGRGFAVVADEVRTLAQRTQKSTEEIDQMIGSLQNGSESAVSAIETSQTDVDYCVNNTKESLGLMEQVSASIQQINQMNSMIATATSEQTSVIGEVSGNLTNILNASNRAAEDSNQAAESGSSLLRISESLTALTSRFKVD